MTSSQHQRPNVGPGRNRLAVWGAMLACLTAAAAIAASAMATPTTATNTEAAGLQKDVDALVAAGAPGAILLVRDGNRTVRLTAGLGNVARKTPMRPDDHFKIASLTKTYTATVVLQLVGEGKLSLDDTVEQRLPGLVPNGDKITIRQLLNHTSGLSDFEIDPRYLKPYLSGNFGYYWAPRQLVRMGVSHKPLFAPGTRYSYSNTNYVLAQLIVEKVTGKTHRCRAEAPDLPAAPSRATRSIRPSRACRARTRTATSCSGSLPRPTSPGSAPRSRRVQARSSPPPETSPTSTGRCSPGVCSSRVRCRR